MMLYIKTMNPFLLSSDPLSGIVDEIMFYPDSLTSILLYALYFIYGGFFLYTVYQVVVEKEIKESITRLLIGTLFTIILSVIIQ